MQPHNREKAMRDDMDDPFNALEFAGCLALVGVTVLTVAVALWTAAQIYGCPL